MPIKEDNRTIILIDVLKNYLTTELPLTGGRHLMTRECQVSLFYNTASNTYILMDPNDLAKTQSFADDKIDDLIKQIKIALKYKTTEESHFISIHILCNEYIPTPSPVVRMRI